MLALIAVEGGKENKLGKHPEKPKPDRAGKGPKSSKPTPCHLKARVDRAVSVGLKNGALGR